MPKRLSFVKSDVPVQIFGDSELSFFIDGEWQFQGNLYDLYPNTDVYNITLSRFDDFYFVSTSGGEIHGGKGNDTLIGDNPEESVLYGDAGDDFISMGQNTGGIIGYGGKGNDTLHTNLMTGGQGEDTFILDAYFDTLGTFQNWGATVYDFKSGVDHLVFNAGDPNAYVTNEGDLWTVHSASEFFLETIETFPEHDPDGNGEWEMTFQIVGVSELSTNDYEFV